MFADKSTIEILTELRSLVHAREFLITLIKKEPGPESGKAAAVANYEHEIAALNAAIEALAAHGDCQADRAIKLRSTGKYTPGDQRVRQGEVNEVVCWNCVCNVANRTGGTR